MSYLAKQTLNNRNKVQSHEGYNLGIDWVFLYQTVEVTAHTKSNLNKN